MTSKDPTDQTANHKTIGFTGRANGLIDVQWDGVRSILKRRYDPTWLCVHGDSAGADKDFDTICKELGFSTVCRPCTAPNRAHVAEPVAEPTNPMARNRELARNCDVLIAAPPTNYELKKYSGSWATIRYARKAGKKVIIVFPNGAIREESELFNQVGQMLREFGSS